MANFDELIAKAHKGNRNCQLKVGEHYLSKGNSELAAEWLKKAADNEEPKAQYHLSFLYFKGAGVTKDFVKALEYLKHSAENDYIPAQTQLGSMYIQGQAVSQDEQMGLFWSRKAAAAGSEIAMYNLGIAYFRGIGMSKNIDKAREFLLRALKKGYQPARDILLNESEVFRSEQDDADDKDYMKKLVASAEAEAEIDAIADTLIDAIETDETEGLAPAGEGFVLDDDSTDSEPIAKQPSLSEETLVSESNENEDSGAELDSSAKGDKPLAAEEASEEEASNKESKGDGKTELTKKEGFFTRLKRFLHKMFAE